jgi:hypothetical protein
MRFHSSSPVLPISHDGQSCLLADTVHPVPAGERALPSAGLRARAGILFADFNHVEALTGSHDTIADNSGSGLAALGGGTVPTAGHGCVSLIACRVQAGGRAPRVRGMSGRWWAVRVVLNVVCVAIMVGIWRHGDWSWAQSLIVGVVILGVLMLLAVRSAKRIGSGQDRLTNWLSSRK